MVVKNRKDYIDKANNLPVQPAYRTINRDPINKLKAKLITILRRIKRESALEDRIYKYMYPIGFTSPKFYGLPKIQKTSTPLRPIISNKGSVTYGVAKVLAEILKLLVDKSPHHTQSNKDFVDKVRKVTLQSGELLCSYHVTALFNSVPVDPALNIIKDLLEQDSTLHDRTVLSVQNIIESLGFCLLNTYFLFQNKFYEQVEGAAVGSPVSPIVANLYMEYFEKKALSTISTPRPWMRYVDDTFVIQQEGHKQTFLEHFNKIDPAIKFTVEGNQENGTIPFLGALVKPAAENSLSITMYRELMHID